MAEDIGKFWNPFTETLPRESIRAIQLKNLRKLVEYSQTHSTLYQHRLKGIHPKEIRTMEDVRQIPLLEKEDLRLAQEDKSNFLFGDVLGVPSEKVNHFRQTSGTTGKPVYVPESSESWSWRTEIWCHILWMAGFRDTDRVFIPFGYNVYVAFWEGHYAAEKLGCMVIPGGALDTKGRINKILEVKATGLLNTPTYGIYLAEVARNMGLDPRGFGIKRMVCAGEPLPQATRQHLESLWNAKVYDHIGGTEPCAWAAMCSQQNGLHVMEPYFLVEILDLETQSKEVEVGELGVAVVTPLGRRSFPMIRFNTKDIVRKGEVGCACGRTSMMIQEVAGRADDLCKIRGVLFTPVCVEELLRAEFPQICEYEIIVERQGVMDTISLKFETRDEFEEDPMRKLMAQLAELLKVRTNLRFNLQPVKYRDLPRYTLKANRFKDLR